MASLARKVLTSVGLSALAFTGIIYLSDTYMPKETKSAKGNEKADLFICQSIRDQIDLSLASKDKALSFHEKDTQEIMESCLMDHKIEISQCESARALSNYVLSGGVLPSELLHDVHRKMLGECLE